MVDALGGWGAIGEASGSAAPSAGVGEVDAAPDATTVEPGLPYFLRAQMVAPSAAPGEVLLDRYALGAPVGRPEQRLFHADDRSTRRPVTVQLLSSPDGPDALMSRLRLGRSISHRSVVRIHDVAAMPWGAIVVMEVVDARTLEDVIALRSQRGGFTADEIRRIGTGLTEALAAIHKQGIVHGDVSPATILFASGAPKLLATAPLAADADGFALIPQASPYHAPERARGASPTAAADVYAFGMTLWALSAKATPMPGVDARDIGLRSDALHDGISRLAVDELRQLYLALDPDPGERPEARAFRFFDGRLSSPTVLRRQGDRLDPGVPPSETAFMPSGAALLVTFAATAPELVGELRPLGQPVVSIGRDTDANVRLPDKTVSVEHATLIWRKGGWTLGDRRSTNGSWADGSYERQDDVRLRHGGEVQLGELRAKLVSFGEGSPRHLAARAYLARHDGNTNLLKPAPFFEALRAERRFADWADVQLHLAVFEIDSVKAGKRERMSIVELLALRRLALRVIDLTDALLVNLRTALAGLVTGRAAAKGTHAPPRIVVVWNGIHAAQAQAVLDTMLAELQTVLPAGLVLRKALASYPTGTDPVALLDRLKTR